MSPPKAQDCNDWASDALPILHSPVERLVFCFVVSHKNQSRVQCRPTLATRIMLNGLGSPSCSKRTERPPNRQIGWRAGTRRNVPIEGFRVPECCSINQMTAYIRHALQHFRKFTLCVTSALRITARQTVAQSYVPCVHKLLRTSSDFSRRQS